MSAITENVYNIKELYIVKIKEDYINYLPDNEKEEGVLEYFNPNIYYIVERCVIENKPNGFYEFYTECIVGRDFYKRIDEHPIENAPLIFDKIYQFPKEYLTKEEISDGKITTSRIFQIFQQLNFVKTFEKENNQGMHKVFTLNTNRKVANG